MNARILTVALAGFLAGHPSFAVDGDAGAFLSIFLSEKSGDISGAGIQIVPNPKGYSLVVQASERAPGERKKRAGVRRQKTDPPRHEGTRMYKVYKAIGELTIYAALVVGIASSAYFVVSLFRGFKTIVSIVVWIPSSVGMFYAFFVGELLIEGWNQQNERSALYGALVLLGSTAVYTAIAYGLFRWVENDSESVEHASSVAPSEES